MLTNYWKSFTAGLYEYCCCACHCRFSDFVVQSATARLRKSEIRVRCVGRRHSGKLLGRNLVWIRHLNLKSGGMYRLNIAENCGSRLVSWCKVLIFYLLLFFVAVYNNYFNGYFYIYIIYPMVMISTEYLVATGYIPHICLLAVLLEKTWVNCSHHSLPTCLGRGTFWISCERFLWTKCLPVIQPITSKHRREQNALTPGYVLTLFFHLP